MNPVHTINNACLTIFGLAIGGTDVTKVLGQTVAMGLDNDCTAATAGSIVGAVVGKAGVPKHWYKNFNNTIHSYLIGKPRFRIDNLFERFTQQAQHIWSKGL
jgi:ADP-ribosylglycohydrolase